MYIIDTNITLAYKKFDAAGRPTANHAGGPRLTMIELRGLKSASAPPAIMRPTGGPLRAIQKLIRLTGLGRTAPARR